jgi:hypothetical protein
MALTFPVLPGHLPISIEANTQTWDRNCGSASGLTHASVTRNARARGTRFSRSFLRSENFWLQNRAILRNAARITKR